VVWGALEAGVAPLLVRLLRLPSRQTLELAQQQDWCEDIGEARLAAAGLVQQLGNCWGLEDHEEAGAARAAGVLEQLVELLQHCPEGKTSWEVAAEALAPVVQFSQPAAPGQPPASREDAAAVELLVQALMHASQPGRQETAARVLQVLLWRSSSVPGAARRAAAGAGAG
jgi:hypothetical protein